MATTKKRRNRVPLIIGIGVLLLIVLAVVGKKAGWFGNDGGIKVAVEKAEKRNILETVLANGKLQSEVEVKISPEVAGQIVELTVAQGDSVRKGQLLARINPNILQSNLDRNNASLNNSISNLGSARARYGQQVANFAQIESSWKRSQTLFQQKVITASEYEQAKAQYESGKEELEASKAAIDAARFTIQSAQASVRETQDQLTKTNIYAPMSGIVTRVNVKVGENVVGTSQMAGTEMMTIANLSRMEVAVDVSENDIVRVTIGDTADVTVDAFPNKKFLGRVREIATATAAASGGGGADQVTNYTVKVSIDPASYAELRKTTRRPFLPGMTSSVEVRTNQALQVLSVPIQSVTTRSGDDASTNTKKGDAKSSEKTNVSSANTNADLNEIVFIVENGKAKQVAVTTGMQDDRYMQILTGLTGKEDVVVAPFNAISKTLRNGRLVQKVKQEDLFEEDKTAEKE